MRSKKFSLKNIDDETAELLDKEYPTELTSEDIDDIFKKSYKKYLQADIPADSETENSSETIVESSPVEVIHTKHRFAFFTLRKVCAVLCGVMAITTFYALLRMPDHEIETPDDINKIPIITDNNNNTSTASSNSATAENMKTTAYSVVTTNTTAVITIETSAVTSSESTVTESVISKTEPVEAVTEIQTEETTVPPETTITTTTAATLTTTSVETTSPPIQTTTEPKNYGRFEYTEYDSDKWSEIKYIRDPEAPIEQIEYVYELDGYDLKVISEGKHFSIYPKEYLPEKENHFMLYVMSYEYSGSFDPAQNWTIKMTEINGRPAFEEYSDQFILCSISWDSGTGIFKLVGLRVHLDEMRYIAENIR